MTTDERARRNQRLMQAKMALSSAIWFVKRAMPAREASGFEAVARELMDRITRWMEADPQ